MQAFEISITHAVSGNFISCATTQEIAGSKKSLVTEQLKRAPIFSKGILVFSNNFFTTFIAPSLGQVAAFQRRLS